MILPSANLKVRLTEKPVIRIEAKDKPDELKDWGRFDLSRKYRVYAVYDDGQKPAEFLLADEDGAFRWISMNICRRA